MYPDNMVHIPKRQLFSRIASLYVVTFFFILPLLCENLGFSWYFISSGSTERAEKQNRERTEAAQSYLSSQTRGKLKLIPDPKETVGTVERKTFANHNLPLTTDPAGKDTDLFKNKMEPLINVCIVITSVLRENNLSYLTQVVAKYLKELNMIKSSFVATNRPSPRYTYNLNVFNADLPPTKNKDAMMIKNLTNVNVVSRSTDMHIPFDIFDKEKLDYKGALEVCSDTKSDYILIVEDDAFPSDNLFEKLEYILDTKSFPNHLWAFLKLYYPEKWKGYGWDGTIWELLIGGTLGGVCLFAIGAYYSKLQFKYLSVFIIIQNLIVLILLGIYCGLVMRSVGRQHWLEFFKLSKYTHFVFDAPGCCTQAILYPRFIVNDLLKYLDETKCHEDFPVDIALDVFAINNKLQRLLVMPNLFYHIGFHSSLKGNRWKVNEFNFLFSPNI